MRFALPLLTLALSAAAPAPKTDPAALSATVKVLASPEFEGRAPGTPGEAKTIAYLIARFKALGLQPGGADGAWTQPVPLVHTRIDQGAGAISFATAAGARTRWAIGGDVNLITVRASDRIAIDHAPLVFVGYGVTAPEAKWDDFKTSICAGRSPSSWSTIPISGPSPGSTPTAGSAGGG